MPIEICVSRQSLERLQDAILKAQQSESRYVTMPDWPAPLTLENAREIVESVAAVHKEPGSAESSHRRPIDAEASQDEDHVHTRPQPQRLLLKGNDDQLDYIEARCEVLAFDPSVGPVLPLALRDTVELKPHQLKGVAWLQHLWRLNDEVGGCLFADDMGLGKTLQLLTFIFWYHQTSPQPKPTLIVAPVSLLENWNNEITKFF